MSTTTATSVTALNAAAEANVTTAILMLIKEALITAIADRRLERGHLRVLAAIATVMKGSAKAWPSRAYLAELSGLSLASVSNSLHELRAWGYLIADKETVEEASNRRLTVYTFGNIDHDTIRKEITSFVQKAREARDPAKFTAHGDDSSPPTVKKEFTAHGDGSPPTVKESKKSSPQTVPRIDNNNIPPNAGEGDDTTPSRKREATTRTKLREDWIPAPETVAWVRENYVASDQQIANEAQKFRDYHVSKGSKMADWRAAWRTWWGNGWHKCPRRMGAHAQMAISAAGQTATDQALHDAFERARLMDEEDAKCRR
jgi:hypothetical protein